MYFGYLQIQSGPQQLQKLGDWIPVGLLEHSQRNSSTLGKVKKLSSSATPSLKESIRTQAERPEEKHQTSKATLLQDLSPRPSLQDYHKIQMNLALFGPLLSETAQVLRCLCAKIGLSNSCQRVGSQSVFSLTLMKLGVFKSPKP